MSPQVYILLYCPMGWSSNSNITLEAPRQTRDTKQRSGEKVWMSLGSNAGPTKFVENGWKWYLFFFWKLHVMRCLIVFLVWPGTLETQTNMDTHGWGESLHSRAETYPTNGNKTIIWATTERAVFHLGRFSQYSAPCVKSFLNDSNYITMSKLISRMATTTIPSLLEKHAEYSTSPVSFNFSQTSATSCCVLVYWIGTAQSGVMAGAPSYLLMYHQL